MKNFFQILLLVILLFAQCKRKYTAEKNLPEKVLPEDIVPPKKIEKPTVTYHLIPMNRENIHWLKSVKSEDTLEVLYALNRVDSSHLFRQDTLVVPSVFLKELKCYSPFPDSLSALNKIHKLILISYPDEAFAAYENGALVRWGPVSAGKRSTPTPTGLFHTNWKSMQAISTVNEDWIMNWYFNLDNFLGLSIHQYDLPGYPASHACIRMSGDDAYWMYHWADQWILLNDTAIAAPGTPIIIFGKYPFGHRRPWRALNENNVSTISIEEIGENVNKFLPFISDRQLHRDSILMKAN